MRVSLRRIAEETGLSVNTVSQILNRNGSSLYRPETCEQVLAVARQLGYRPNASARFMLNGTFDTIALLQRHGDPGTASSTRLVQEAVRELQSSGLHLMLVNIERDDFAAGRMPMVVQQQMTDGFLIDYLLGIDPQYERLVDDFGRPGVWLNQRRQTNAVFPDDRAGAEALAEALLTRNPGQVAYLDYSYGLSGEPGHYSEGERRAGWRCAVERRGQTARLIGTPKTLPRDERHAFTRAWLAAPDRPRSVIVGTETAARAVVVAALAAGLRLPEDLVVATFSEAPITDLGVAVTSWIIDYGEMGREAAAMLVRRMRSDGKAEPAKRVSGRLAG